MSEPATKVFKNPERWGAGELLHWARFPTSTGPIDIWLPRNVDVETLIELGIPRMEEILSSEAAYNEKVAEFVAKREAAEAPPAEATDDDGE